MAQNNNIVVYALFSARGAQQLPAGQTYHLPPFTLVGEYSHRRHDRQSISAHKLGMGVPHHPINKPPPEYLCWRDAVKDQMLARGYISDNWHFPDAEFQQIVEGMRRLKPACNELATVSAANNMASMQEIDEAVLQLVKDYGKKLANTIRTNNHVPPPGPGVPPAQVIVSPMLLPLNAPPQCQWSIATAVVPNAGPVGQNTPLANAPGPAQNVPAPQANPQAQNIAVLPNARPVGQNAPLANAPGPAQNVQLPRPVPKPYLLTRRIPKLRTLPHPHARPIPKLRTILHPQALLIPNVGLLSIWAVSTGRKNLHQPVNIPGQIQSGPSMGILGTPLGIKHAPANPPGPIKLPGQEDIRVQIQADPPIGILGTPLGIKHALANPPGPINLPGPEDIPVQIQADPPMGILGRPMGMQHAPLADIPEAAAPNLEDPLIQSFDLVRRVRRAVSGISQIGEFFWQ